jgi:hypothetical protein
MMLYEKSVHIGKKILSHMLSERWVTFIHLYLAVLCILVSGPGNFEISLMCVAPWKFVFICLQLKTVSGKCEKVLHKTGILCWSSSSQFYWYFSIYTAMGWLLPCTFCELDSFPFTYPYCYCGKATNILFFS